MEAFLLLADSAQQDQANGKIHMLGAGWSQTGPVVPPMAVVAFLRIPWEEARQQPRTFAIRLVDEHGDPVTTPGVSGDSPLRFEGQMALDEGRQPTEDELKTDLHTSVAINLQPPPLKAGHAYTWVLDVDQKELASLTFAVRPLPQLSALR